MSEPIVDKNSNITIHFSLQLSDMSQVDGTEPDQPMTFTMGDGTMITAFEDAILGMKEKENRQVRLAPRETFGFPDEANLHWLEKNKFDHLHTNEQDIQNNLLIEFKTPSGEKVPGVIKEIKEDKILVDFNHPLAGHELLFSIEIVSINP